MADTRGRMLRLLSLLQSGRSWPGAELAARLAVSPRTLRRDVERLRELGYPVSTARGPSGHYRLVAGAALPPLVFADDEAVALAVGLRLVGDGTMADVADTAARTLRKVEQFLPDRLRRRVRAITEATATVPDGWPQVTPALLHTVAEAGHRRHLLDFDYRDRDGAATRRRVEPYRQVLVNRRWYLLAWDRDRADWRVFRMDRIGEPVPLPGEFAARELPCADVTSYVNQAVRGFPLRHTVVVELRASLSRAASLLSRDDGALEAVDEHWTRYTVEVDSYEWMAVLLGVVGLDYRIVSPPGFADYSRRLAARIAAAARQDKD